MSRRQNHYKQVERYMIYALCADTAIFILYLVFAGLGIVWLKITLAVLCLLLSSLLLGYLYLSGELLKRRSLYLSTGAVAIALCLICSLVLNFPSPNKYKPQNEKENTAYFFIE